MNHENKIKELREAWEKYENNEILSEEQLKLLFDSTEKGLEFLDGLSSLKDEPSLRLAFGDIRHIVANRNKNIMSQMFFRGMIS